jgi:hypothetical protein
MQAEKITAIHAYNDIQIETGTVQTCDGDQFRIFTQAEQISAAKAFSCLVEPQPGDIVLFSREPGRKNHILSITERPDDVNASLKFPGEVTLNAAQGLNLSSAQDITLASEQITVLASTGLLSIDSLNAVGTKLMAKIDHVQTVAETVETVAGQLLQKLKNSFRLVEGVDQTRAQDVITTVRNLYSMRSKQAAILAKKDIKVDAERIHMG